MNDDLAERLLARVMAWSPEQFDQERSVLTILAGCKYDQYEQFRPGMRFVQSLALWLEQFSLHEERVAAYAFVKQRLIFISQREMNHLVVSSYPYYIRPHLVEIAGKDIGCSKYDTMRIIESDEFGDLNRRTLYLGLSDGARIDVFRRGNGRDVSNEQILPTYQISAEKSLSLKEELKKRSKTGIPDERFRVLVLLDDFNGSGGSLIRKEKGEVVGKIPRLLKELEKESGELGNLVCRESLHVIIVCYISTVGGAEQVRALLRECNPSWIAFTFMPVQTLTDDAKVTVENAKAMVGIIEKSEYYDESASRDPHLRKGGADTARYGFAKCALPLVLNHNTPNNTIFLFWANDEDYEGVRGLFPRVPRHRSE